MTNREIGGDLFLFPSLLWRAKKTYMSQGRLLEETRRRKVFPTLCKIILEVSFLNNLVVSTELIM